MTTLTVEGHTFSGLSDTGADQSIIRREDWPKRWPIQQAEQTLRGLGIASNPDRSTNVLNWKDEEGNQGVFQPYVLDHLPVNLWGRVNDRNGVEAHLRFTTHQPCCESDNVSSRTYMGKRIREQKSGYT